MALQAWFPLNKDINNKGFVPSTSVNNGATLVTDGKFGKSYSFGGSQYIDTGFAENFGTGDFTLCAWVYIVQTANKTCQCIVGNKGTPAVSVGCCIYWNQNQKKFLWSTANGSTSCEIWTTDTFDSIIYNSWHHIAMVRNNQDSRKGYFYIDGVRKEIASVATVLDVTASATMKIGTVIPTNSAYYYTGKVNDVRIYNHAISEQDAKDLYWGKVLEFTPQWKHSGELSVLGDASGLNYPLTPYDVTLSNNISQVNGTSSYVGFSSPNISGGSVSIWFSTPTKPNSGYKFLYYDPVSKMLVTFSSDGTLHVAGDGSTQPRYQTTGITWGQLTNVVATWDSNRKPTALYVNGVKPATGSTTTWSTAGTACAIGRRLGTANGDYFSGSINEVKVFASQLTAVDAQYIYHIGPNQNKWTPDEPVWLRILHHNAPATNLFTQANSRDNDDENLFSKLKVLFNNDNFRRADGNYEFMAKEKLNSTSTEQTYRWTQTSNPTASTCTGYKLVSQTNNPGRNFGISFGPTGNCVFSNKNAWWCALGCWTAYQGGIPGFENVVKTGYMDLYVRADKGGIPNEYIELEYIESTGASYFNTGEKFNCESDECKVIFKGNDTANNGMIFASSGGKYFWFYYYSNQGIRVYADNGNGQQGIAGIASDLNKHTMEWKGKHYYIDGVDKGTMSNTYTETTNNIWLFSYGGSSYPFKGRIYYADIKRGGIYTRIFKPVKRRSDSVAGMYDVVTNTFFPSSATAFTAGPEI